MKSYCMHISAENKKSVLYLTGAHHNFLSIMSFVVYIEPISENFMKRYGIDLICPA